MRILALASWWPEPADNGIKLRLSRLLRSLASTHEVHLLCLCEAAPDATAQGSALPYCASAEAETLPAADPGRTSQISNLLSPWPASARAAWSEEFAALVRRRAARVRPEAVVAFELAMAPYARLVPGAPRVLDDLELATLYDGFVNAKGRRRVRRWLTWAKHRAYVREMLRDFAAYTVVSPREATLAAGIAPAGKPALVLPNGADMHPAPPAVTPEPDTLIYPGALSYAANLDAMRYFLAAIFPQVRAARPEVRLRITGRTSPEQAAALPLHPGVELTGFVDDIRGLVARSWAEVVPLRTGSGTRLKILEALAVGTPVVSTSKGAEGLDLRHGHELLVADSPGDFAAATLLLLAQPGLRAHLADAGRRAVRGRYDWGVIGAQLDDLLRTVVAERRVRRGIYAA